jgi:hypothetical protein
MMIHKKIRSRLQTGSAKSRADQMRRPGAIRWGVVPR